MLGNTCEPGWHTNFCRPNSVDSAAEALVDTTLSHSPAKCTVIRHVLGASASAASGLCYLNAPSALLRVRAGAQAATTL